MKKLLLFIIIIAAVGFSLFDYYASSTKTLNTVAYDFSIAAGDNLVDVGKNLETSNVISSRIPFYYYAWREKLRGQIKKGDYIIPARATFSEMTSLFTKGEAKVIKKEEISVTLPEGLTTGKMAAILTEAGLPGEEFSRIAENPSSDITSGYTFLKEQKSLHGYLFPDTYKFFPDATAEDIVTKLLDNFAQRITPSMLSDIAASGKSLHEVIILSSIVEGEVNKSIDRSQVAGVFQNRLDIGMALQSDATIDFIKGIPEIKHTLDDIAIDDPYNTYLYAGLPPGPINNPSLASIVATISPADTSYIFFLNNAETGETVFSETFDEHIANKAKNGL